MRNAEGFLCCLLITCVCFVFPHQLSAVDPTFTTKDYAAGSSPGKMVTADFNRDGIPDLALVSGGGVSVLLGNGDGSFQSPVTLATGAGAHGIAVGDFNGDGIPDIATGNSVAHSVSILIGTGNGAFQSHADFDLPATINTVDIAAGDFNGDGKLDVGAAAGQVFVLFGNGNGTLQSATQVATAPYNSADIIASGDFNGDGRTDLIFTDCCDPQTIAAPIATDVYLINAGNGSFTPVSTTDAEIFAMTKLNANGDQIADLATSYSGCHTPCVGGDIYVGQQGGAFPKRVVALSVPDFNQPIPGPAVAADFNGDGKIDLAYAISSFASNSAPVTTPPHHAMLIMLGTGGAAWSNVPLDVNLGPAVNQFFGWSATADFNNDGRPDIATTNPDTGVVTAMLNSTGGTATPDFTLSISPQSATVNPGQSADATVSLTSQAGFNTAVTLSCSGLPSGANCSFNPASLAASPSKSTSTLIITTSGPTSAAMKHYGLGLALPMFGLALAGTLGKRWRRLILVGLAILGLLFLMSCGGVSKSSNNPGSPTPSPNPSPTPSPGGTPSGSYTVTINASGGNVQHSTIFTLNVQ